MNAENAITSASEKFAKFPYWQITAQPFSWLVQNFLFMVFLIFLILSATKSLTCSNVD
jgi:hypothetical protein